MSDIFKFIITNIGRQEIASAIANETTIILDYFSLGDSNGLYSEPSITQTALVNEIYRDYIQSFEVDKHNDRIYIPTCIVYKDHLDVYNGDFEIREMGLWSTSGNLFAVCKVPLLDKINHSTQGASKYLILKPRILIASQVDINIDISPHTIIQTDEDLKIKLHTEDIFDDFIVSGFTAPSLDSSIVLEMIINDGIAVINGKRVKKQLVTSIDLKHIYTASKDTYIDLKDDGTLTFVEVNNGAGVPAVTADSLRLRKVVTDAIEIISTSDLRNIDVVIDRGIIYLETETLEVEDNIILNKNGNNATAEDAGLELIVSNTRILDFNLYTKYDPYSEITIDDSNSISWDDVSSATTDVSYLVGDYHENAFDEDFEFQFQYKYTFRFQEPRRYIWGLSNNIGDRDTLESGDFLGLSIKNAAAGSTFYLQEYIGGNLVQDTTSGAADQNVYKYFIIERDESVGTYGTLYCYIYSDVNRTSLIHTLSITLRQKIDWRYHWTFIDEDNSQDTAASIGVIEDCVIISPLVYINYSENVGIEYENALSSRFKVFSKEIINEDATQNISNKTFDSTNTFSGAGNQLNTCDINTPDIDGGTIDDARINLPEINEAVDLTATSTEINGFDDRIILMETRVPQNTQNIALEAFRRLVRDGVVYENLVDGVVDEFHDESGVDTVTSTNETYSAANDTYVQASDPCTLISEDFTAESQSSNGRIIIFEEDEVFSVTLNTHLKAYISRDGGTTYTQVTLSDEGDYETDRRVLYGDIDISGQPSGITMKWKIEIIGSSNDLKLHGVALLWN